MEDDGKMALMKGGAVDGSLPAWIPILGPDPKTAAEAAKAVVGLTRMRCDQLSEYERMAVVSVMLFSVQMMMRDRMDVLRYALNGLVERIDEVSDPEKLAKLAAEGGVDPEEVDTTVYVSLWAITGKLHGEEVLKAIADEHEAVEEYRGANGCQCPACKARREAAGEPDSVRVQ